MTWRIFLSPPDVTEVERAALLRAFDSGWVAPVGPEIDAFEKELAALAGVTDACALSSGTAGLHLALHVLGVGPGQDVMVPTLTFAATANAVAYLGAQPVFVDCDPGTWNMSADLLEAELRDRSARGRLPAAVVAVDLYGSASGTHRLATICGRYGVPLVEDAAEALGALADGEPAGSFGHLGVFSFNGNKILTTSGGGAVVARDGRSIARIRYLATQARQPVLHYEHTEVGFNYRLSNLLAALGRAQLTRLPAMMARRRAHHATYRARLSGVEGVAFQRSGDGDRPNHWLTAVTLTCPGPGTHRRDAVLRALHSERIEARPIWKPLHLQPVWRSAQRVGGDVAERIFAGGVCLPSGSSLSDEDAATIGEIVALSAG